MDISTKNNLEKAAELVTRLQASFRIDKKDEEDQKNWQYVIYARKSTDDKSESKKKKKKQEQSIGIKSPSVKSTLIDWSKDLEIDIKNLRQIHLESVREKYRADRLPSPRPL